MRILISGDDGPPGPTSPYVLGLWRALLDKGWDVSVVLPSAQKSWGGMHFQAHDPVAVWYYYPRQVGVDAPLWDEGTGAWSPTRRPVNHSAGELGEWVLLDASPASCANAGVYNHSTLFPSDDRDEGPGAPAPFDLVVTGPNYGRNTGTSFALGSGTLGSALAGALAQTKAIALSFAHFQSLPSDPPDLQDAHDRLAPESTSRPAQPSPADLPDSTDSPLAPDHPPQRQRAVVQGALDVSVRIVEWLYTHWEPHVAAYSVNVPLAWAVLEPKVVWTRMWVGQHTRLYFDPASEPSSGSGSGSQSAAQPMGFSDLAAPATGESRTLPYHPVTAPEPARRLLFRPGDMRTMLAPPTLQEGTDIWAVMHGWVSISRVNPAFVEPVASAIDSDSSENDLGNDVPLT